MGLSGRFWDKKATFWTMSVKIKSYRKQGLRSQDGLLVNFNEINDLRFLGNFGNYCINIQFWYTWRFFNFQKTWRVCRQKLIGFLGI